MSAAAEFPRGWAAAARSSALGVNPVLTLPAMPGLAHVLTSLIGTVENTAAGNLDTVLNVDGGAVTYDLTNANPLLELAMTAAGFLTGNWSGEIVFPINQAVTITYNAAVAGAVFNIIATGYPI